MICIFDCETIPDAKLVKSVFNIDDGSDLEISQEALKRYEKDKGTTFLPIPFHQVVSISAVIATKEGEFIKVSSIDGDNEEQLIKSFLSFIDSQNPRLVSFNGRGFDLPMLMTRAMKYNLSCPAYFETDDKVLKKSKWENYKTRYCDKFHLDLNDFIADFGAVRGIKLDLLCKMSGIPGKYDVSGDQVMELYYQEKLETIKEYCESDVINTYWLFLKYELLRGKISLDNYYKFLEKMANGLDKNKSYYSVFYDKITNQQTKNKG